MGGIDLLTEAVLDDVLTARARLLSWEGDPVDRSMIHSEFVQLWPICQHTRQMA